jgi:hypothetical protein
MSTMPVDAGGELSTEVFILNRFFGRNYTSIRGKKGKSTEAV